MARGTKPWKQRMNKGSNFNSWQHEQEEKKKQRTLTEWDEEEEDDKSN